MGYAVLAVAARILPGFSPAQLVRSPATYTLAAAGIVSFLMYASALEGGSVTVATAAVVLAETVPPAIVGVVFLGDTTRRGLTGLAVAGFVLAVTSAVALARFGEAGEQRHAGPGDVPASATRPIGGHHARVTGRPARPVGPQAPSDWPNRRARVTTIGCFIPGHRGYRRNAFGVDAQPGPPRLIS